MSIKKRTLLLILCTTAVLFVLFLVISDTIFLKGYEELERQSVEENVNRVSDALSAKLDSLDKLAYDWAVWDDTYQYAQDHNSEFITRNLADETFVSTDLSFLLILNSLGQVVFSKAFDHGESREIAIPEDIYVYLSDGSLSSHTNIEDRTMGNVLLSGNPAIIISRPILTSLAQGPSAGTLIVGRFLDHDIVESLAQTTHLSLSILNKNNDNLPLDLLKAVDRPDGLNTVFVHPISKTLIAGYTVVTDFKGNPAFVFEVDMQRQVLAQGQKTLNYLHASLLFICVVFCIVLIIILSKTVLERVTSLNKSVSKIGLAGSAQRRISIKGKDEISSLANSINRMLNSIDESEAEIHYQKSLMDRILSSIPNAVLVVDNRQFVVLANDAFYTLFDVPLESAVGRSIATLPNTTALTSEVEVFLKNDISDSLVEFQNLDNGPRRIVVTNFTRMTDEGLLLMTFTDVTGEREKQDKLYLTDRLVSVGTMASGIAHELNNPLTSVIGLSQLLSEEDLQGDAGSDIRAINKEAQRASQIVKNLLSFARRHEPNKQHVQIADVINDVMKLRDYEHKINNIVVTTDIDPNVPNVMVDYFQMQQVFLNIVLNAEQAMIEAHDTGTLLITVKGVDSIVRISFTDNGPGIRPENLKRIFDPFFTTKEVGKGTGLGLSICYGIVTAHGGSIYAESEYGRGATFIVELPINSV